MLAPSISHLCIETDAYDLRGVKQRPPSIHNRREIVAWADLEVWRSQTLTPQDAVVIEMTTNT